MMMKTALFVRLETKAGKAGAVAKLLIDGLARGKPGPAAAAWFALRLGPSTFGLFEAFNDESGRQARINAKLAAALKAADGSLFAQPPVIEKADVLAANSEEIHERAPKVVLRRPRSRTAKHESSGVQILHL